MHMICVSKPKFLENAWDYSIFKHFIQDKAFACMIFFSKLAQWISKIQIQIQIQYGFNRT